MTHEPVRSRRSFPPRAAALAATALLALLTGASALAGGAGCASAARVAASGPAVTLAATLDRKAVLRGRDGLVRLEVVLQGREGGASAPAVRVPTDLIVVLDRSGSMAGQKLVDARAAVHELIAQLASDDRFALVSYSSDARTDIALAAAQGPRPAAWHSVVSGIVADGGTNMSSGLDLGLAELARARRPGAARRVILVSDGLANQGDPTLEGLTARARQAVAQESVLSTVGIGLDFNEQLMTRLADTGTGNFHYVTQSTQIAGIFRSELAATAATVASSAALVFEPAAGVRLVDAAGYPIEPSGTLSRINVGSLFAGQARRLWLTIAVPTAELGDRRLGSLSVGWVEDGRPASATLAPQPVVACVEDEARYVAAIDRSAWGRGVATEEYAALQQAVSQAVKEGRREAALAQVDNYIAANARMNARVSSEDVAKILETAKELRTQVEDAFTGENQHLKQGQLGKKAWAAGQDGRRGGAKATP